ncbi:hypothetical protein [Cohnella sp. GCM10012308]|uniref:hypothetical protein n=1 Tax=Cohnella sp. GCM10012308 TaxID=3317329 RepID=UPI00361327DC
MSRAIQDDGLDQEAAGKVPPLPGFFFVAFFLHSEGELMEQRRILVAASHAAGRDFIRQALYKKLPVAALANNVREEKALRKIGVSEVVHVNTSSIKDNAAAPAFPIGRVFIFEASLPLTCRYLQWAAGCSCLAITVVTHARHPEVIYKKLGATYVVRTQTGEVGFLLSRLLE